MPITQNKYNKICKGPGIMQFINISFSESLPSFKLVLFGQNSSSKDQTQSRENLLALFRFQNEKHQPLQVLTCSAVTIHLEWKCNVQF